MDVNNLTNVYNQNPTIQGQYTLQQYLDMFGGSSTGTTTPTTATTTTTPTTNASQGIINANINQYQGGGGGGGIQTLDPYSRPQGKPLDPNSFLGKTFTGLKDFGSSVVDKFSGFPGVEQGKGLIQNIMDNTMVGRLAAARNPLNPKASNYNQDLQGQIDNLEGMTGTGITGTSDNLKFTDGLAMIGRDPNSGLGKYGPGSVLSGQNIVSGFGTNDYGKQLQNYIDKMMSYKTRSKFQQAKIDRAYAELKAEEKRTEVRRAEKQKADQEKQRGINARSRADAYDRFSRGDDSAYASGAAGQQKDGSYNDPFDRGGGEKDGGYIDGTNRRRKIIKSYFDGGIVSLRRR